VLDFWAVYERVLERTNETSLESALRSPELARLARRGTPEQVAEHSRAILRAVRRALVEGDWAPYLGQLRELGVRYAELGVGFSDWYSAVRVFQLRLFPALIEEYGAAPARLTAAISAATEFLDFSNTLVAETYVATRQEDRFRLLVDSVKDYAIYMLGPDGVITSWNSGAEALKGYQANEVIGRHVSVFFPAVDREAGRPARLLEIAARDGRFEEEAPRVRKGGSQFWASVVVTAIRSPEGALIGFAKVVHDLTERKLFDATLEQRTRQLEESNRELEAFSYSVAHDLRTPLRAMSGFSRLLLEDHAGGLDPAAVGYLTRIQAAAGRMGGLIDALLELFRLARGEIHLQSVELTEIARAVAAQLAAAEPHRVVDLRITDGLHATADAGLARTLLENLLGNAWKFTSKAAAARIEIGTTDGRTFFVRDNGAGFDMARADKLFAPFQRLHTAEQFAGTGIGLANVQRIVRRHGGRIWAEAQPDKGATFFFTLAPDAP